MSGLDSPFVNDKAVLKAQVDNSCVEFFYPWSQEKPSYYPSSVSRNGSGFARMYETKELRAAVFRFFARRMRFSEASVKVDGFLCLPDKAQVKVLF